MELVSNSALKGFVEFSGDLSFKIKRTAGVAPRTIWVKTMYEGTSLKIQEQASYLKKIHAQGNMQNLDLFDEPYKLALNILDCQNLSIESCAAKLGIHEATVKQVRKALNI